MTESTGYCANWIWILARCYNQGGLQGLADQRKQNTGAPALLRKLDHGAVTTLTTAEISLALNGTTLTFSIEKNVVDTVSISALQPTQVAIVYDCVGYGANQTINGNYLLIRDFSYQVA